MKDAIKLMEDIAIKPPGPITTAVLDAMKGKRTLSMDNIRVIDGQCSWCNVVPLLSRRKKYCDSNCKNSAYFYCYPQNPGVKMWIFINRQDCTCPICGECFEDEIKGKINETRKYWNRGIIDGYEYMAGKISYYAIGNNTGHKWQVDHKIPIHRGGDGIGLTNIQIVCVGCHQRKTVSERVY